MRRLWLLFAQTVTVALNLTSAERYGTGDTVQLDAFRVAAQRDFEGSSIAIGRRRSGSRAGTPGPAAATAR